MAKEAKKPDTSTQKSQEATQSTTSPPPSISANIAFNAFQGSIDFNITSPAISSNDIIDDNASIFKINTASSSTKNSKIIAVGKPYYGYALQDSKPMKVKDASKKLGSLSVILSSILSNGTVPAFMDSSTGSDSKDTKIPDDEIQYTYIRVPFIHGPSVPDPDNPKNSSNREKLVKMHTFAVFDDSIFDPKNKITKGKLLKLEFLDENFSFAKITAISGEQPSPSASPGFFFPLSPIGVFASPANSNVKAGTRSGGNGIILGASTVGAVLRNITPNTPSIGQSKRILHAIQGTICQTPPCGYEPRTTYRPGSSIRYLEEMMDAAKAGTSGIESLLADSYFVFIMTGANGGYKENTDNVSKKIISTLGRDRYYFLIRGSIGWGANAGGDAEAKQQTFYENFFNNLKTAGAVNVALSSVVPKGTQETAHQASNPAYKTIANQIKGIMSGETITL